MPSNASIDFDLLTYRYYNVLCNSSQHGVNMDICMHGIMNLRKSWHEDDHSEEI